ncbi:MAG TPA: DUF2231 domain-containing protein [Myxococcota bacterium]|nr:DUF2231 domain-containing protein [Myxococcota bacterium]
MPSLPDPLHPMVVHFPIVFAALLPWIALGVPLATARGWLPRRAWAAVVLAAALVAGAGWMAEETGEDQEKRVEKVVAKDLVEQHAERAEHFVELAVVTALLAVGGLVGGRPGRVARIATVVASLAVLGAVVLTGKTGGELVYKHGAANAYLPHPPAVAPSKASPEGEPVAPGASPDAPAEGLKP